MRGDILFNYGPGTQRNKLYESVNDSIDVFIVWIGFFSWVCKKRNIGGAYTYENKNAVGGETLVVKHNHFVFD